MLATAGIAVASLTAMATGTLARRRKRRSNAAVASPPRMTARPCPTLGAIQCRSGYSTAAGWLAAASATGEATASSSVELEAVTAVADPA